MGTTTPMGTPPIEPGQEITMSPTSGYHGGGRIIIHKRLANCRRIEASNKACHNNQPQTNYREGPEKGNQGVDKMHI